MDNTKLMIEMNSILKDFDKFLYSFEQSINLLSHSFIVDNEKYDAKKIDQIFKEIKEVKEKLCFIKK